MSRGGVKGIRLRDDDTVPANEVERPESKMKHQDMGYRMTKRGVVDERTRPLKEKTQETIA